MLLLRCTAKLLSRLHGERGAGPPATASTTRLGDWYATLLPVRPAHLVLAVNERTRLAVVLPAKELATLTRRLPLAIAEVLRELGVAEPDVAAELAAMSEIALAPTASRSVLGTMNDFAFMLEVALAHHPGLTLAQHSAELNDTPVSPLKYAAPEDAARAAFGLGPRVGRNAEWIEKNLRDAEESRRVLELRVTLCDVAPPVWRRLHVRAGTTLHELHRVLQRAMGWRDAHLHQFTTRARPNSPVVPEPLSRAEERREKVGDRLRAPGDTLVYEYDFGDGWEHEVTLERVLAAGSATGDAPRVVAGERACPPEDSGGPPGYERLLTAFRHPFHPEHRDAREWLGEGFDPEAFDLEAINHRLRGGRARPRARKG